MQDLTAELIASLADESSKIMIAQSYLRGGHRLTDDELKEELRASQARRYTLIESQSQIVLAGVYR